MVSTLDLPRPGRLRLFLTPRSRRRRSRSTPIRSCRGRAGVAAAVLFAAAGTVRTVRAHHELVAVRRTADRLIVHSAAQPRCVRARALAVAAELTTRAKRDALRREVERTLSTRSTRPASRRRRRSSRPAARGSEELFGALAGAARRRAAVAARGVLLAQSLLRDSDEPALRGRGDRLLAAARSAA